MNKAVKETRQEFVTVIIPRMVLRVPLVRAADEPLGMTRGEQRVYELLVRGKLDKEIADRLGRSVSTVKFHNRQIYRKAGVANRGELLRRYGRVSEKD